MPESNDILRAADPDRWSEIAHVLSGASRVAVATHIHPDGDAVGSQMALVRLLRNRGVDATPVLPDDVPENFKFLDPEGWTRTPGDPRTLAAIANADVMCVVDVSKSSRLGRLMNPVMATAARRVLIDHHVDGDFPSHHSVVDPRASSTGELIHELWSVMNPGAPLPAGIALPLYVAVLTDTGGFRFSNTSARTHALAGEFLSTGLNPEQIHHWIYDRNKPETVRLLGLVLAGLVCEQDNRFAWVRVGQEHFEQSGARPEDVDGFVDFPRTIAGIQLVILFMELPSGKLKVSLRSRDEVNVHQLAFAFGGGGHRHAAGILMDGPWDKAREAVLEAARATLVVPRN